MGRSKISIIGAGMVGTIAAFMAADKKLGNIVLIDINGSMAKGKALDLQEALPLLRADIKVAGGGNYALTKNSDIVVVTAGVPRRPGMSRDDLLQTNAKIILSIIPQVVKHSPNCHLVIVTNPLDAMVYLAKKISRFPKNRIMGMAGVLDSTRFRTFIAQEAGVGFEETSAFVLGGHGDNMVPLARYSTVAGQPLSDVFPKPTINKLIDRTRKGGAEIVGYLKTGSAFYAPGVSIATMIQSIVNDKKRVLPCAAELHGEYGVKGLFIGVPCVIGANGIERIVEVRLSSQEKKMFAKTVSHVKELSKYIDALLKH